MSSITVAIGFTGPGTRAAWRVDNTSLGGLSLARSDPRLAAQKDDAGYTDYVGVLRRNEVLEILTRSRESRRRPQFSHELEKHNDLLEKVSALPTATGIVQIRIEEWESGL